MPPREQPPKPLARNAWVVAVDMGYGHARAAYALRDLAHGGVIAANNYPGVPAHDRRIWESGRKFYETVSRMQPTPLVGEAIFDLLVDRFQRISPFYPRRDLSEPSFQTRQVYYTIERQGVGKHLVETLRKKQLPLICTFFLPAFAAEVYDYPGDIYIAICDADISRAWVSKDPRKSRIKYFAPNGRVVERLRLYGVRSENIYLTGFPLPKELIGGPAAEALKGDLVRRLCNLDPQGVFWDRYGETLVPELGATCKRVKARPVTITFSIGGAGAQKALAIDLVRSIRRKVRRGEMRIVLVAGIRKDVARYFAKHVADLGLTKERERNVRILYEPTREKYFARFSRVLRDTDVLWTKPSEMSFYAGLGIPIVMAPPIGSQEAFNRQWLTQVGAGIDAQDARYADEWVYDWVQSGGLARMAWNGYIEAPTHGAYRIESIITGKPYELAKLPLVI